ncbi:phytol kinase [Haloferula luteola]|uniref:Phytol kinase n=1 Tax=Haloferula luteola TaxID=595692 RepID=A0A840V2N2_9BACT|nr:hypothetical protein [Haloferula luteola]MBB5352245.1 phytol kinase [Haloferula luteola]
MNPWVGMAVVTGILAGGMWMVSKQARRWGWDAEVARKSIHMVMGLVCLTFPLLFREAWPVGALACGATLGLAVVRWVPRFRKEVGGALHGVTRASWGELCFAPAVALVFVLAGDRVELFAAPVLVLTLADAAGAVAGSRWGRSRYGVGRGWKSVEGSAVFWVLSIGCVGVPAMMARSAGLDQVVWMAVAVGLLATMAEGLSDRGLDNAVLPLWVFFLMQRFLGLEVNEVMVRCGVVVLMLLVILLVGRFSTLDGGALMASALLGYGLALLGGMGFLGVAMGLFAIHLFTTGHRQLGGVLRHGRESVFGAALAMLPWAAAKPWIGREVAWLGCGAGAAAYLVMMHVGTRRHLGRKGVAPLAGLLKVLVVLGVPVVCSDGFLSLTAVAIGLAGGAMGAWICAQSTKECGWDAPGWAIARGVMALGSSAIILGV